MATDVRDNPELSRYELFLDGAMVGVADYRIEGATVVFPHTEVDPLYRGQGLAAVLVRTALDHVRASGRTVVPQCWYVAEFMASNPAYRDLAA
jgi:uncharacterized protein